MTAGGYNPIKHDCKVEGVCYNKKFRPRVEEFAECFPGSNAIGDVDYFIERYGNLLILEWKLIPVDWYTKGHIGQRIAFERVSVGKLVTVICAAGNPETMVVTHCGHFVNGKRTDWYPADLGEVKRLLRKFETWAKNHDRTKGRSSTTATAVSGARSAMA